MKRAFLLLAMAAAATAGAQSSRQLDDLNWMEFRKLVPGQIKTVLLTTGTVEAHGVINNGADNSAPIAMARAIAAECNALVAPHVPYGMTGSLTPYPGGITIPEEAYKPYLRAVMEGLAKTGFRNIIVLNGHGGGQTAVLQAVAQDVALSRGVNTLVVNWWTYTSDITKAVFGEDGGHAANNETAYIQAINPTLVHRELYSRELATPLPAPGAWSAVPFPSTIMLYKEGEGYPKDFDQKQADEYFRRVNAKVAALIKDTIRKWQLAGLE
jgi:creatinine amidohydrolase